jgi:hypothetical protein
MSAALTKIPVVLFQQLKALVDPAFWEGLSMVIIGALTSVGAFLLKIFTDPLIWVQAGLSTIIKDWMNKIAGTKLGKVLGLSVQENDLDKNIAEARENSVVGKLQTDAQNIGAEMTVEGLKKLNEAQQPVWDEVGNMAGYVGDAIADSWKNSKDVIDTGDMRKALSGSVDDLKKYGAAFTLPGVDAEKETPAAGKSKIGGVAPAAGKSKIGGAAGLSLGQAFDLARMTNVIPKMKPIGGGPDLGAGSNSTVATARAGGVMNRIADNTQRTARFCQKIAEQKQEPWLV